MIKSPFGGVWSKEAQELLDFTNDQNPKSMKGLRYMTIGSNIRKMREHKGLTQCELAERAGVSQVYISFCESGRREPSLKFCQKLAAVLNCPISAIVETDERRAV